jgi:putative transposase
VRFTTGAIRVERDRHHVTLPRLGKLRTHESTRKLARRVEAGTARVLSATLSEDSSGRWHVAFQALVRRSAGVPAHAGAGAPVVGVDAGVKAGSLLVVATPDGREIKRVPAPKSLTAAQGRLRALQRKAARQQGPWDPVTRSRRPPSKRWRRTSRRVGRTHAHAAAVRRDVLHKETTALAQRHQVITVETLNARGMRSAGGARKKGLNLALSDAALAEIRRMLGYKCAWYGSTLVEAGRYFPSSKTCSACGRRKPSLTLADRTYECDHCGLRIDRDHNAAVNLARLGDTLRTGETGTGTGSSPAASHRAGNGRGATQETAATPVANAAGDETSTRHSTAGKTGTAPPQGEAA